MLHNDHSKAGKELQRRIAKLREENKDPSLPQKVASTAPSPAKVASPLAPPPAPSPPPHARNRMSESQQPIEESFMLLGQRVSLTLFLLVLLCGVVHAESTSVSVASCQTSSDGVPMLERVQ